MTLFTTGDGNTPLSPDEQIALIPDHLSTKEDLNEWERLNIIEATRWALHPRRIGRHDPLTEPFIRDLHLRMFDETWEWAGTLRTTDKNLGVPHYQIRDSLGVLLGDARFWLSQRTFALDEIAIRFHHRLVFIHPFPNGNGRHARLMADVLITKQGGSCFTWGNSDIGRAGDFRRRYLDALRAADQHDIQPLIAFARS